MTPLIISGVYELITITIVCMFSTFNIIMSFHINISYFSPIKNECYVLINSIEIHCDYRDIAIYSENQVDFRLRSYSENYLISLKIKSYQTLFLVKI